MVSGLFLKNVLYKKILIIKQIRFLISSTIVTSIDYSIFFSLIKIGFGIVPSNIISYLTAISCSFFIQKTFVFNLKRQSPIAFFWIIVFSLFGVLFGTFIIFIYNLILKNIIFAKVLMTISMFFYNFYTKKIAFGDHN